MNKEELQEKALQYALGTLPQSEHEEVERLVSEHRELRSIVYEWQKVNEVDACECDQVEPSFHIYSSVMSRIDSANEANQSRKTGSRGAPLHFLAQWGGWAAAAGLAIFSGISMSQLANESSNASPAESDIVLNELGNPEQTSLVASEGDEEEFQNRLLELTGLAEAYWFSREGLPPEPGSGVDAEEFSGGFSIYDRKIKIGVIGIENIPEGRLGRYYSVWAKPSEAGDPVWAGMIQQGEPASRLAFFDLSSNDTIQDSDEAIFFFVTEETEKRPVRPEGKIVLSGI
ncbi:MAG TPA: hypothetical protein DIV79_09610 [Opitutae bacterium]|nr:hypothetical protein [Opitutaceae bacterium]HCR30259.1 hypothetical protein [Opitutae bacterium]